MLVERGNRQRRTEMGKPYAQEAGQRAPVRRVAMPHAPRRYAPEATVHAVARCNNRESCFTRPEDFTTVLGKLLGMVRDYELPLYAYTVLSNHVRLLLQAPRAGTLARPLRWFLTETARGRQKVFRTFPPERRRLGIMEARHEADTCALVDCCRTCGVGLRWERSRRVASNEAAALSTTHAATTE